jgi:hypothetical protein
MATPSLYHWLPFATDEVSCTLPPWQKEIAPEVDMVNVGVGVFILTIVAAEKRKQGPLLVLKI